METEVLKMACNQGLGYALFVFLLIYVLKTTGNREKKYQDVIDQLAQKLNIVEDIKEDIKDIKNKIN